MNRKVKSVLFKLLSLICIVLCVYFIASDDGAGMVFGTIFLIAGIVLFCFSSSETYNKLTDTIKCIDNPNGVTVKELSEKFANMPTPLGKAWVGKIKTIKGDCLIYGPGIDGSYLYLYPQGKHLYVCVNEFPSFIDDKANPNKGAHKKTGGLDYKDELCNSLNTISFVEDLCRVIQQYIDDKTVTYVDYFSTNGMLYKFDENFKLFGQNFCVSDMDGNPLYDADAGIPIKTFHIYRHGTKDELCKVTKRILHVMPHYDFYINGEKFGSFVKNIVFSHTTFSMDTREGKLVMRSVNATFGDNYIVKLNGVVIGTIAEKLNLTVSNLVFDNYVLYVQDEKYTVLLIALATMAARELTRSRNRASH